MSDLILLNMNKKISIMVNITAVVFLANICGASFLGVYVTAIGVADVSAPEFYIGSAKAANETLLINEESPNCGAFHIEDDFTRVFITEENLGGVDFNYLLKAEFSIRAHISGTTTPQDLTLKFGYIDTNNIATTICFTDITLVNQMENYTTEFINCLWKPTNVKHFYYEFSGNCDGCKYTICKCAGGFYTKVELEK